MFRIEKWVDRGSDNQYHDCKQSRVRVNAIHEFHVKSTKRMGFSKYFIFKPRLSILESSGFTSLERQNEPDSFINCY
jgi:hypothetical protein